MSNITVEIGSVWKIDNKAGVRYYVVDSICEKTGFMNGTRLRDDGEGNLIFERNEPIQMKGERIGIHKDQVPLWMERV